MKKYLLVLMAFSACRIASTQRSWPELAWSLDARVATPELIRPADDAASDIVFVRPMSIRADSTSIVIADAGDDRVVILDSRGRLQASIERRGSGPGELRGPSHLALRNNTLLVGEARNGRISEFTLNGDFIAMSPSGFAAGSVSADSTHVFTASRSTRYYASRVAPQSSPIDAFSRPVAGTVEKTTRWFQIPGHDLLVTHAGKTWVFDQGIGILCAYGSSDARPTCYRLPESLNQRLVEYRDQRVAHLENAIRMQVEAAPLIKDLIAAGRYLALLLPLSDLPVVMIDTADASLTAVKTIGGTPAWVLSARSFAWDGRDFLLVGDDGLARLRLSTLQTTLR